MAQNLAFLATLAVLQTRFSLFQQYAYVDKNWGYHLLAHNFNLRKIFQKRLCTHKSPISKHSLLRNIVSKESIPRLLFSVTKIEWSIVYLLWSVWHVATGMGNHKGKFRINYSVAPRGINYPAEKKIESESKIADVIEN